MSEPMTEERRREINALKTCLKVDRMRHQRALDDALAEVDRLTAERDAALADRDREHRNWVRDIEKFKRLGQLLDQASAVKKMVHSRLDKLGIDQCADADNPTEMRLTILECEIETLRSQLTRSRTATQALINRQMKGLP